MKGSRIHLPRQVIPDMLYNVHVGGGSRPFHHRDPIVLEPIGRFAGLVLRIIILLEDNIIA